MNTRPERNAGLTPAQGIMKKFNLKENEMKLTKGQLIYRYCYENGKKVVYGQEVGRGAKARANKVVMTNGGGWVDKCKAIGEGEGVVLKLSSAVIPGPHIS